MIFWVPPGVKWILLSQILITYFKCLFTLPFKHLQAGCWFVSILIIVLERILFNSSNTHWVLCICSALFCSPWSTQSSIFLALWDLPCLWDGSKINISRPGLGWSKQGTRVQTWRRHSLQGHARGGSVLDNECLLKFWALGLLAYPHLP